MRWPKYWNFSFSISLSKEYSGLISFRMDWLDLLAIQGTLKSLLQHHSSKASILRHSVFFTVQLSNPYMTTGKTIALIRQTLVSKVGEGTGTPLQYSCLKNPMDGGAWWAAVHGVAKSRARLSNFTFTFHFHALEKEMETHFHCSCLENPRDGGDWWAAVYGVAQSRTRLKRLSSSSRLLPYLGYCK